MQLINELGTHRGPTIQLSGTESIIFGSFNSQLLLKSEWFPESILFSTPLRHEPNPNLKTDMDMNMKSSFSKEIMQ